MSYTYNENTEVYTVPYSDLDSLLQSLPANTVDTPYKLNITDIPNNALNGSETTGGVLSNKIVSSRKYIDMTHTEFTNVTNIESCFYNNTYLVGCPDIGNTIINMYQCFYGCINLTITDSLIIPNSVTSLDYAFYKCKIDYLPVIPDGLINLYNTFAYVTFTENALNQLVNYNLPNSLTKLEDTFNYSNIKITPIIPESVTEAGFRNCIYLEVVQNVPENCRVNFSYLGNLTLHTTKPIIIKNYKAHFFPKAFREEVNEYTQTVYKDRGIAYIESDNASELLEDISYYMEHTTGVTIPQSTKDSVLSTPIGYAYFPPYNNISIPLDNINISYLAWNHYNSFHTSLHLDWEKVELPSIINITNILPERTHRINNNDSTLCSIIKNRNCHFTIYKDAWEEETIQNKYNFYKEFYTTNNNIKFDHFEFPNEVFNTDYTQCFAGVEYNGLELPEIPNNATVIDHIFDFSNIPSSKYDLDGKYNLPKSITSAIGLFESIRPSSIIKDFSEFVNLQNISEMFQDITFTQSGSYIFDTIILPSGIKNMDRAFKHSSLLPNVIPPSVESMIECFQDNVSESFPDILFDIPSTANNLSSCFYRTSITKVPKVIYNNSCNYNFMFANCSNLTTVEDWRLPPSVTTETLLSTMFYSCPNLTTIKIQKPQKFSDTKWDCVLVKTNNGNATVTIKNLDNTSLFTKTLPINSDNEIIINGYIDEYVHAEQNKITNSVIEKILTYKKPFSSDSHSLDPSTSNFVLWADNPNYIKTNLPSIVNIMELTNNQPAMITQNTTIVPYVDSKAIITATSPVTLSFSTQKVYAGLEVDVINLTNISHTVNGTSLGAGQRAEYIWNGSSWVDRMAIISSGRLNGLIPFNTIEDKYPTISDLNTFTLGTGLVNPDTNNKPAFTNYGTCWCIKGSSWLYQMLFSCQQDTILYRKNINNGGWSGWNSLSDGIEYITVSAGSDEDTIGYLCAIMSNYSNNKEKRFMIDRNGQRLFADIKYKEQEYMIGFLYLYSYNGGITYQFSVYGGQLEIRRLVKESSPTYINLSRGDNYIWSSRFAFTGWGTMEIWGDITGGNLQSAFNVKLIGSFQNYASTVIGTHSGYINDTRITVYKIFDVNSWASPTGIGLKISDNTDGEHRIRITKFNIDGVEHDPRELGNSTTGFPVYSSSGVLLEYDTRELINPS